MEIKDIFFELIKEAKNGKIKIKDEDYLIGFNTNINNRVYEFNENNYNELVIKDLDSFLIKLERYINEELKFKRKIPDFIKEYKNKVKFLMIYLFVNFTTENFTNPEEHIEKYINFLNDNTLDIFNDGITINLEGIFSGENIVIRNYLQSVMMETPNKFVFLFKNKENEKLTFLLPEISYGVSEENGKKVCYIYSIINKEKIENTEDERLLKYKKTISRRLYKLNKGISNIEEYDCIDEENIRDISVSSALSLYLFINIIMDKVDMVKGVVYLPIRFLSRDNAINYIDLKEKKKFLRERNEKIQHNLTEKFIRTFRRVELYIDNFNIDSYPYEIDEYITCSFNKHNHNKIIDNDVINSFRL